MNLKRCEHWIVRTMNLIDKCVIQGSLPSVLHVSLAAVLISVFRLCYGPGILFRGLLCVYRSSNHQQFAQKYNDINLNTRWPATCFSQTRGHLHRDKMQRKSYTKL
jgi:hypothetical protein